MKTKFGYMKCENRKCGERVVVKTNERGTLSYTCDECDKSAYAQKGTREHQDWLSEIEQVPGAKLASESKPAKQDEKPAAKKPSSVLDF